MTLGRSIGSDLTQTVTLPTGGGGGSDDGVIDGLSMANSGVVTVTRTVGADITSDFSSAIHALIDARALRRSNNLSDLHNAGNARSNLGVLNQSEVDDRVRALSTDVSINDVLTQILAGTNVTIDRGTPGQITVASTGGAADGVANALTLAVNGQQLTVTIGRSGGLANLQQSVTLPTGGGGGGSDDGVITDISISNSGTVTITRSVGDDITNDFSTAINSLIQDATNSSLDSVAYNDSSRRLTFGTLGGGTTAISLAALNEFHGEDPTGAIDFERGDTVMLSDVLYFYTANTGSTIQVSNVSGDNRFVQLSLTRDVTPVTYIVDTVGGNGNAITLTTGKGFTGHPPPGTGFIFRQSATNTTAVQVTVDSGPQVPVLKANGLTNTSSAMAAGDMIGATLQHLTWNGLSYSWATPRKGDASLFNVGTEEGEIAVIGPGDKLPSSVVPNRTHYDIPPSGVGGNATNITLTTGDNLSVIPPGTTFFFAPASTSNNNVSINVDGIGAVDVLRSDGVNATANAKAIDLFPVAQVVWEGDVNPSRFYLQAGIVGTAAHFNHGTGSGDLAFSGFRVDGLSTGRMNATGINGFSFSADNNTLFGQRFGGARILRSPWVAATRIYSAQPSPARRGASSPSPARTS